MSTDGNGRRVIGDQHVRDPRLTGAAPAAPASRMSARPAPPHMALPQDESGDVVYHEGAEEHLPQPARSSAPVARPAQPRPAAAAQQSSDDSVVVELSKTYMAHGEPVTRITLRKPVAKEIGKIGNPLRIEINEAGVIQVSEARWDRVMKYVVALSTPPLPPSTVDQFEFFDLDACAAAIGPFFLKLA